MSLRLIAKRTARKRGCIGLGVRLHLPVPVIYQNLQTAMLTELQLDLLLWCVRVQRYRIIPVSRYVDTFIE